MRLKNLLLKSIHYILRGVQTVNYVELPVTVTLGGLACWLGLVLCPGCVVLSECWRVCGVYSVTLGSGSGEERRDGIILVTTLQTPNQLS